MVINLDKLTPAPWGFGNGSDDSSDDFFWAGGEWGAGSLVEFWRKDSSKEDWEGIKADGEFIALARNAFEVMMRRKWRASYDGGRWYVDLYKHCNILDPMTIDAADPFTALVEADKWYRENVENKPTKE
jgi:hypothetical protein